MTFSARSQLDKPQNALILSCRPKPNTSTMATKRQKQEEQILEMLKCHGRLDTDEVCNAFQISESTARRYFTSLEQQGELIRVHGGIILKDDTREYSFDRKAAIMTAEKSAIAKAAAELIQNNEQIFLDTGTTLRECGNFIAERLRRQVLSNIKIVTSSLAFTNYLPKLCNVTLTGGTVRTQRCDLAGITALNSLQKFRFDKAILGADAIGQDGTLFTTDEDTAALATTVIKLSASIIILADSSKIGQNAFVAYGQLTAPNFTLVTNPSPQHQLIDDFKKNGINVITATP